MEAEDVGEEAEEQGVADEDRPCEEGVFEGGGQEGLTTFEDKFTVEGEVQ